MFLKICKLVMLLPYFNYQPWLIYSLVGDFPRNRYEKENYRHINNGCRFGVDYFDLELFKEARLQSNLASLVCINLNYIWNWLSLIRVTFVPSSLTPSTTTFGPPIIKSVWMFESLMLFSFMYF